jgi:hypothetical protein
MPLWQPESGHVVIKLAVLSSPIGLSSSCKGSAPRPKSVDEQTFADRWEQAFGVRTEAPRGDDASSEAAVTEQA